MPTVRANGIDVYYEQQGSGEPLVLIPYLAADQACYAFQVADYAKYFTCISVDLRGAGQSDKPSGTYSSELFADDVAANHIATAAPRESPNTCALSTPIACMKAGDVTEVRGAAASPDQGF